MDIYLLRHGQSVANERMLVCGDADYPLSELGRQQARRVCEHLTGIPFSIIYSSSLSRARDTVSKLTGDVPVVIEPRLCELSTGEVSHITLPELWAMDSRYRQPWLTPDLRYPGGETFNEMFSRITGWFVQNQVSWAEGDNVLIVAHEGTLRSIYVHLFGMKLSDYPDFHIGNCDYLHFSVRQGEPLILSHVPLDAMAGTAE